VVVREHGTLRTGANRPGGKAVRPKLILGGLVTLVLAGGLVAAQDAPAGLQTGPATIAPHWTRNTSFPTSIPEGAVYYVVVRGDTLWDIAERYLKNPYLWPQIWDQNKYVTDAHWIYPGDPLVLPKLAVVAEQAGQAPGAGLPEGIAEEGEVALGEVPVGAEAGAAAALAPVTEELSLQCAMYIVQDREDESLYLVGSEQGGDKTALSERDIVYLNKGSNAGVRAGDLYTLHHAAYTVRHPVSGRKIGTKVEITGWVKVILVQEDTACAVIEQSCLDIHAGDYLRPFEKVNVPMVVRRAPAECCEPPNGKITRHVVDLQENTNVAGTGNLVMIDAGAEDGIAPGNEFSVYRILYPSVPSPRDAVGMATVVAVRERTATAKLTYARKEVVVGDEVELR
jgi:LysM repeat protein